MENEDKETRGKDGEYPTKAEIESINFKDLPRVHKVDLFYDEGARSAAQYEENKLLEMLQSRDILDIYEALGALSKRKLKSALPLLNHIAKYDEDMGVKEEAMRAIRYIGGKKSKGMLKNLNTPEHREFIEDELGITNK